MGDFACLYIFCWVTRRSSLGKYNNTIIIIIIIIIIILSKKIGILSTWKNKEGKTSKFVNAGGYNTNEREREELTTWNGSTEKGGGEK